ncbi:hypothetical protein EG328_007834 [Venturia inaequalis]|uniref:Uncharacterized protein n=1 Tax=Venturia inaequalis TaxID=5025 RepID=A0A8H3YSQ0_VENIN|nr:hypothetical protein EG328_007834 [Venturia inaequalis]
MSPSDTTNVSNEDSAPPLERLVPTSPQLGRAQRQQPSNPAQRSAAAWAIRPAAMLGRWPIPPRSSQGAGPPGNAWPQPGWGGSSSVHCPRSILVRQLRAVPVPVPVPVPERASPGPGPPGPRVLCLCSLKQTDEGMAAWPGHLLLHRGSCSSRMSATGALALETVVVDCDIVVF